MPSVQPDDSVSPLVLVVDAGSSSLRASIYDGLARAVAGWSVKDVHPLHFTADGGVEEDAEELVHRVAVAIDGVLSLLGNQGHRIGAVGMASLASSLVGIDNGGRPVTPIYAYSDARPAAEVRELRATLDEEAIHQRTGCRLHTSYLPARLLWLRRTSADVYARVAGWRSLPEALYERFLGQARCSLSIASWSGLLDRRTLRWDSEWLDYLAPHEDSLAPLDDAPLLGLRPEYAGRWPVLAGVPWFPAWGDGAASNIGSDCATASDVVLNIGTSAAMRVVTETPPEQIPRGLWCYRVDRGRALVGGALNEGGGAIAWVRDTLRIEEFDDVEDRIATCEPDGHGLTVLPFLAGERSPGWNADLRATVVGLRAATTAADIVQAWLEAIAYRFGLIAGELDSVAPEVRTVTASGGGTRSTTWSQIIADVLNRPVMLSNEVEATGRGVAMLVLAALGHPAGPIPATGHGRVFHPIHNRHAVYARAMARQQRLYERLADWQGDSTS
jgi:gluconokinase